MAGLLCFGHYMQLGAIKGTRSYENDGIVMQQTQDTRYENYRLDRTQLNAQHVAT